jgi:hypothetical protein
MKTLGTNAKRQLGAAALGTLAGIRRGGRVVYCDGLENRCAGNRAGGSNPSPSAKLN